MQRNLGANAGLDYRELTDFLMTIISREQADLSVLLEGAGSELSAAATCERCACPGIGGSLAGGETPPATASAMPADELGLRTAGAVATACLEAEPLVDTPAWHCHCGSAGNGGAAEASQDAAMKAHVRTPPTELSVECGCLCRNLAMPDHAQLWQRADSAMLVTRAIADEPRCAAVLQTLFNLKRAHAALAGTDRLSDPV